MGCDGRCGRQAGFARRAKRSQRTAKSCGPGAATVASIPAGLCWRGNGDKNRRSPGRARISRKPLRGESRDVSAVPVVQPVCSFAAGLSHTGLRAQSAPCFPCALFIKEGQRDCTAQAKSRCENESARLHFCERVSAVAGERRRKQSNSPILTGIARLRSSPSLLALAECRTMVLIQCAAA